MKTFIISHWYRFILASSAFIFSCAFMLYVLKSNTAKAGDFKMKYDSFENDPPENDVHFVAVGNVIYKVSWDFSSREYVLDRFQIVH